MEDKTGKSLRFNTQNHKEDTFLYIGMEHIDLYRVEENYVSVIRILDGRTNYLRVLFDAEDN